MIFYALISFFYLLNDDIFIVSIRITQLIFSLSNIITFFNLFFLKFSVMLPHHIA
jgi:hypothetical protein